MTRRLLLAWLLTGTILVGHRALRGQSVESPDAVNEARARAVLAKDSIRLQLPFAAPASIGGRAVVQVLSPAGTSSEEISADFREGARLVNFDLPWPKDEKGKPAEDVGWYRIAYRIESANGVPAKGILSIGAIAPNLLTLRLALPEKMLASGKPLTVRVYAGNPVTRKRQIAR